MQAFDVQVDQPLSGDRAEDSASCRQRCCLTRWCPWRRTSRWDEFQANNQAHATGRPSGRGSSTIIFNTMTNDHRNFARQSRVSSSFSETDYERQRRCWSRLIRWLCPLKGPAAESQDALVDSLGIIMAKFLKKSPDGRTWRVGLGELRREVNEEDDMEFRTKAPDQYLAPDVKRVLDFGLVPPCGCAGPLPLHDLAQVVANFAKFANAAYSLGILAVMRPHSCLLTWPCWRDFSRWRAFQQLAGIRSSAVLYANTKAHTMRPVWWLCLDHASRSVVLCIRGTFAPSDLLSDLMCRQVEYNGHVLHEGFLLSAQWVRHKVAKVLHQVKELESGGYRLVVTGHSLGAAIASVLTWLLREDAGAVKGCHYPDAMCFTIGCPLSVDEDLARKMLRFVIGVVHHRDLVPTLSLQTAENLRDRIVEIAGAAPGESVAKNASMSKAASMSKNASMSKATSRGNMSPMLTRRQSTLGGVVTAGGIQKNVAMFSPGFQMHLRRRTVGMSFNDVKPILRKAAMESFCLAAWVPPHDFLQQVRPAITSWPDHFPQAYVYVCEAFAERLTGEDTDTVQRLDEKLRLVGDYFEAATGFSDDAGRDSERCRKRQSHRLSSFAPTTSDAIAEASWAAAAASSAVTAPAPAAPLLQDSAV